MVEKQQKSGFSPSTFRRNIVWPHKILVKAGHGGEAEAGSMFTLAVPQAFNVVFEKAIQKTAPADEVKQRVINLTDEITYSVYMYTARGLFERDKLIFLAQVTFQVPKQQPVHLHWRPLPPVCVGGTDSQDP